MRTINPQNSSAAKSPSLRGGSGWGLLLLFFSLLLLFSCSGQKKYQIGVSQCSEDDWRALLNIEIDREARFFGDMEVDNVSANDDSERQTSDIERFIAEKKDLIIVAPNVAADVQPAIEKAMQARIPVILIDRRTQGDNYTAFIGADNRAIGRAVAEYIEAHAVKDNEACANGEHPLTTIIELRGLKGSSPDIERHEGFTNALNYPQATLNSLPSSARLSDSEKLSTPNSQLSTLNSQLSTLNSQLICVHANWNEDDAKAAMDSLLLIYNDIDYVFAQNDRMARGAHRAIEQAGRTHEIKVIGVDGLTTPGGGVDMVLDGSLLATHTYPTGGSEAIQLAHKILTGEPYEREIVLPSALVDASNARVMHLQYLNMVSQDEKYRKLESLTNHQIEKIGRQQTFLIAAAIIIVLLIVLLVMARRVRKEKRQADEILMLQIQDTLTDGASCAFQTQTANDSHMAETSDATETTETAEAPETPDTPDPNSLFRKQVEEIIIAHMGDSDFSVNDIAAELGISRVQLYRKIKSASDLIRTARLEKARQLLATTDKTISEVAYSVGFSSPSYFTKCFKEFFGTSPSEAKKGM